MAGHSEQDRDRMAKSRSRKKPRKSSNRQIAWGGMAAKPSRNMSLLVAATAFVLVAAAAAYFWRGNQASAAFEALAATGQSALSRVESPPSRGGGHLSPGQEMTYPERFPTSGMHDSTPVNPGFYENVRAPTMLVHSVEHGHIVIYYDDPGAEAIRLLREWTSFYTGHWDGVIAVPAPGLGKRVVLTAWAKRLQLALFDAGAAAAFIDKYRGRGPENPVR
jgi:hypothetical protein